MREQYIKGLGESLGRWLCDVQKKMAALHASLIIIEWLHLESRIFRHCLQGADAVPEDVDCVVVLLGMQQEVDSFNW